MRFYCTYSSMFIRGFKLRGFSIHVQIDSKSEAQGFNSSRLPSFTAEDAAEVLGSADFLAFNHYTANIVYPQTSDLDNVSWYADCDVVKYQDPNWYP